MWVTVPTAAMFAGHDVSETSRSPHGPGSPGHRSRVAHGGHRRRSREKLDTNATSALRAGPKPWWLRRGDLHLTHPDRVPVDGAVLVHGAWLANFNTGFIGFTGTRAEINLAQCPSHLEHRGVDAPGGVPVVRQHQERCPSSEPSCNRSTRVGNGNGVRDQRPGNAALVLGLRPSASGTLECHHGGRVVAAGAVLTRSARSFAADDGSSTVRRSCGSNSVSPRGTMT